MECRRPVFDLAIRASRRFGKAPDLKLRKCHVALPALERALTNNGRDEVVFQDAKGDLYVLDAAQLAVEKRSAGSIRVGDRIKLGGVEGDVVLVDKDPDRSLGFAVMSAGALAAPVAAQLVLLTTGALLPALVAAAACALGAMIAGQRLLHPEPDDRALEQISVTLAGSKAGYSDELEAQLGR